MQTIKCNNRKELLEFINESLDLNHDYSDFLEKLEESVIKEFNRQITN